MTPDIEDGEHACMHDNVLLVCVRAGTRDICTRGIMINNPTERSRIIVNVVQGKSVCLRFHVGIDTSPQDSFLWSPSTMAATETTEAGCCYSLERLANAFRNNMHAKQSS